LSSLPIREDFLYVYSLSKNYFTLSFFLLFFFSSMAIKNSAYEQLLSTYCDRYAMIELLKQHRPYLELLPSMRRPEDSLVTIPLPVVRTRKSNPDFEKDFSITRSALNEAIQLSCDLAVLMCDPEWQIKMEAEILIFIHRPGEDFSDLLMRWRHTQVHLDQDYEWLMPPAESHMLNQAGEKIYPLFLVFSSTPKRIIKGLEGAGLPFIAINADHHNLHGEEEEEEIWEDYHNVDEPS
jgi:hypothetical protein